MKKHGSILLLSIFYSLYSLPLWTQVNFKTIIPLRSINTGESFQVQFILENADKISDFSPPSFRGFRIVTGPNLYSGKKLVDDKTINYQNIVFTLAALTEGKFKIPGASCLFHEKLIKSNDVFIKVVSQKESDESSYILKPGEDPIKKIHENLFLKLTIDRKTCFIGEPLVATFKLYSRLQSRSNIVKNPGFYGFSVYDMVDVNDKIQSEEKLNGHWFDVHTIRKLQLYPLESGAFTIDPMELANKVEFSRSAVNKNTEQEVSENMYNKKKEEDKLNTEEYEMNIKSSPVIINVKPLPRKAPADTFAGAVGNFSIDAFAGKDSLLKNEQGSLTVDIRGAGNFQRVNAPLINWPGAIEVFEPSVKDTFDKQQVPLSGQREFKYIFVSDKPGVYHLPPISFTFFNIKTKTYKTISTKPFVIFISAKSKKDKQSTISTAPLVPRKTSNGWIIAAGLVVLLTGMFLLLRKRSNKVKAERQTKIYELPGSVIPVEELITPAKMALENNDKLFFEELQRSIWSYCADRFGNANSKMSKKDLSHTLTTKGTRPELIDKLIEIIQQCEAGIYTNVEMNFNKPVLLEHTRKILSDIDSALT